MTRSEVSLLLSLAAARDYRKIGEADVLAWFEDIGDLEFEDAKVAVSRHYRESTDRIMPAHIRRGVKALRAERARQVPSAARELPSRFEPDINREIRMERGAATVREVLAPLAKHLAERSAALPPSAVEELRAITAGPDWAPEDGEAL